MYTVSQLQALPLVAITRFRQFLNHHQQQRDNRYLPSKHPPEAFIKIHS